MVCMASIMTRSVKTRYRSILETDMSILVYHYTYVTEFWKITHMGARETSRISVFN